jgi:hypothetical protein
MGLDMNLYLNSSSNATQNIGYWRKANHIHKWFVDNVQDGNDDCGEYKVSHEKIVELKTLCEKILTNRSLAPQLLPTCQGFFFGSYSYDDYYFEDVKHTIKICEDVLSYNPFHIEIYYRSSW